ncbi:unnamed protein product [Rotaria socialis]|uniref:Uncharacterized protein n=1 Tax=Rotaria socialis TaxID=392032 RepID=A0A820NQT1_9BILA|nr:unnamed protein product [Rotaria socialis]
MTTILVLCIYFAQQKQINQSSNSVITTAVDPGAVSISNANTTPPQAESMTNPISILINSNSNQCRPILSQELELNWLDLELVHPYGEVVRFRKENLSVIRKRICIALHILIVHGLRQHACFSAIGIHGGSYLGDIAIDDLIVLSNLQCTIPTTTTTTSTSTTLHTGASTASTTTSYIGPQTTITETPFPDVLTTTYAECAEHAYYNGAICKPQVGKPLCEVEISITQFVDSSPKNSIKNPAYSDTEIVNA